MNTHDHRSQPCHYELTHCFNGNPVSSYNTASEAESKTMKESKEKTTIFLGSVTHGIIPKVFFICKLVKTWVQAWYLSPRPHLYTLGTYLHPTPSKAKKVLYSRLGC